MTITMSWVIRNKVTKEVVLETYSRRVMAALNKEGYEAIQLRRIWRP